MKATETGSPWWVDPLSVDCKAAFSSQSWAGLGCSPIPLLLMILGSEGLVDSWLIFPWRLLHCVPTRRLSLATCVGFSPHSLKA